MPKKRPEAAGLLSAAIPGISLGHYYDHEPGRALVFTLVTAAGAALTGYESRSVPTYNGHPFSGPCPTTGSGMPVVACGTGIRSRSMTITGVAGAVMAKSIVVILD